MRQRWDRKEEEEAAEEEKKEEARKGDEERKMRQKQESSERVLAAVCLCGRAYVTSSAKQQEHEEQLHINQQWITQRVFDDGRIIMALACFCVRDTVKISLLCCLFWKRMLFAGRTSLTGFMDNECKLQSRDLYIKEGG